MVIEICDDEGTKVCLSDSAKISTLSLRKAYDEKTWCVSFHAIRAFVGEVRQEKLCFLFFWNVLAKKTQTEFVRNLLVVCD